MYLCNRGKQRWGSVCVVGCKTALFALKARNKTQNRKVELKLCKRIVIKFGKIVWTS